MSSFLAPTFRFKHCRSCITPRCTATPQETGQTSSEEVPKSPPQAKRIPILTFLFSLSRRKVDNIEWHRLYRPVYATDAILLPVTVISDLPSITTAYKSPVFSSRDAYPPNFTTIFGDDALPYIDGKHHTAERQKLTPAFSSRLYGRYFDICLREARAFWQKVQTLNSDGDVTLVRLMKNYYLRFIIRMTTGELATDDLFHEISMNFGALAEGLLYPSFTPPFRRALKATDRLIDILCKVVRERLSQHGETIQRLRTEMEQGLTAAEALRSDVDLLTVLCASSPPDELANAEDIRKLARNVLLLWNAGHATQASQTLTAIMCTLRDKTIHERLRREQDEHELSARSVQSMPLLASFMTETLRMYPAASASFRRATSDVIIKGFEIKKGSIVVFDYYGAQRDERLYEDPDEFNLERFLGRDVPPVASFGAVGGAHFCLGAALSKLCMKTTMAVMLREVDVFLAPQRMDFFSIPEVSPASGVVVEKCVPRKGQH